MKKKTNEDMEFDFTDSPEERPAATKKRPPPVPVKALGGDPNKKHAYNPGMPPRKTEATPFGGRQRSASDTRPIPMNQTPATAQSNDKLRGGAPADRRAPASSMSTAPAGGERRRSRSDTSKFQMNPNTPLQAAGAAPAKTAPGESSWDVYVDGGGVYKVPAPDEQSAKDRAAEWLNGGGDPSLAGRKFEPTAFQAVRGESLNRMAEGDGSEQFPTTPPPDKTATNATNTYMQKHRVWAWVEQDTKPGTVLVKEPGYVEWECPAQYVKMDEAKPALGTEGLKYFKHLVNQRIQEIVRKKEGGGGYNLYSPNKGKKKNPKPVGEFPTRMAAKRAELARFPPKDPEQLKRARTRLDKLSKDPKKQQAAARKELSAKGAKRTGKSAGERKAKKESIINRMVGDLTERLFREDEVPGSPWDERISSLHPDAMSSDKKLHRYSKGIEMASQGALGDSHKALAKVLRGLAKITQGDVMRDPDRGKMYMPVNLDVEGNEIGPIHLYVDGGSVCIEISQEAREMIAALDPMMAKNLRGGLMSFQEDHLPKIDKARKAWTDRDTYLDKLHQRLEKSVGGMSAVELHLAKQMMNKRRR